MNIIIKDEQGLGTALMMDGFSQKEIFGVKDTIKKQFKEAAITVFQKVLGKPLPETIIVELAQNDTDELEGRKAAFLGSFNSVMSQPNSLRFTIHEKTVKDFLNDSESELFTSTIIHEMFHAADLCVLSATRNLVDDITKEIYSFLSNPFLQSNIDPLVTYLGLIQMLDHYRAEGIAILGESLLTQQRLGEAMDAVILFRIIFAITMERSKRDVQKIRVNEDDFDVMTHEAAYHVAPFILLLLLEKRGGLANALRVKVLEGLCSGQYNLTEQDVSSIMKSALALTLPDYIQGLLALGDKIAPIQPFLEFCAMLQGEYDADNINSFTALLRQPIVSARKFDETIGDIMGIPYDDDELDAAYQAFCNNPPDEILYPELKEKVMKLFSLLKTCKDVQKQRVIRWALTYFFDDEDVIHDDIEGIGLVDDALVVDYALNLVQ